jgi:hypothetical protein
LNVLEFIIERGGCNPGIVFGSDSRSEHHQNTFEFVVRLKNKRKDAREKRVLYMYSEKFVELR